MARARVYKTIYFLLVSLLLTAAGCSTGEPSRSSGDDWKAHIRADHPRLFFNRDTWPQVKERALNREAELFGQIRARVDETAGEVLESGDYGTRAAEAAFVFLVTGDGRYLELAKSLLSTSLEYYHLCFAERRSVSWYSFSRINAWAAYDWLFSHLSGQERKELGASFLLAVKNVMPTGEWAGDREPFERENWSGPASGFYGTRSLAWYAGLAAYREGIDDSLAGEFLEDGYGQYTALLAHRGSAAGDDGGSASAALNYALAAYPWAEFNFFHTFQSATGRNIALDWPYMSLLPGYIFWNWLPGGLNFGTGDSYHRTNEIRLHSLNIHLTQILRFYGRDVPEIVPVTKWLLEKMPREQGSSFPLTRFLLTGTEDLPHAAALPPDLPWARHFENMGQVFFRSGSGPEDTYALFTAGGTLEQHRHFDNNNFVIYHKGFLALDTGTRPEPGMHLYNYYCRTVAHNCVLIKMPGERMPSYWGKAEGQSAPGEEAGPPPNDGGQCRTTGSRVAAFESGEHYAYVAGDATACYHPDKCRRALRQFVFIPPGYFIVFDRVSSTRPEYKKTWLLHTAAEPRLGQREFSAVQDGGRLFCRTLLPEEIELTKVGGPGRQFWNGGRNWPLPEDYRTPDTTRLLGQWRVELSPVRAQEEDFFLHLIQAGDSSLEKMVESWLVREDARVGVRFDTGRQECRVLFGTVGEAGGHITVTEAGRVVVDRDLAGRVAPQKGLTGKM
ncbi:MAG: heparinase II/III family protein [Candidatus Glassbacteria bacterium]|nr:heparinase II/III family protein [Candidatus Glassbacteria bacterium]